MGKHGRILARFRADAPAVIKAFKITGPEQRFTQVQLHEGEGAPLKDRSAAQAFCTIGLELKLLCNEGGSFCFTAKYFGRPASKDAGGNTDTVGVRAKSADGAEKKGGYIAFMREVYLFLGQKARQNALANIHFTFDSIREWLRGGEEGPRLSRNETDRAFDYGRSIGLLRRHMRGHEFVDEVVPSEWKSALDEARKLLSTRQPSGSAAANQTSIAAEVQAAADEANHELMLDIGWSGFLIKAAGTLRASELYRALRCTYKQFDVPCPNATMEQVVQSLKMFVDQGRLRANRPQVASSEMEYEWVREKVDLWWFEDLARVLVPHESAELLWLFGQTGPYGFRMAELQKLIGTEGCPFHTLGRLTDVRKWLEREGYLQGEGATVKRRFYWVEKPLEVTAATGTESVQHASVEDTSGSSVDLLQENAALREQLLVSEASRLAAEAEARRLREALAEIVAGLAGEGTLNSAPAPMPAMPESVMVH